MHMGIDKGRCKVHPAAVNPFLCLRGKCGTKRYYYPVTYSHHTVIYYAFPVNVHNPTVVKAAVKGNFAFCGKNPFF